MTLQNKRVHIREYACAERPGKTNAGKYLHLRKEKQSPDTVVQEQKAFKKGENTQNYERGNLFWL